LKSNLTPQQKADLYPDFYRLYKSGAAKGIGALTVIELATKWDSLMKDFLDEQKTYPGRERLRRLGFKIEEPKDECKTIDREVAESRS
jgi:hypothetical protein